MPVPSAAGKIDEVLPSIELVRSVDAGTGASMTAIRLAGGLAGLDA